MDVKLFLKVLEGKLAEKDPFTRDWAIVQVPYGGGFGSLNISKPKGTKSAPKALRKEFMRQSIFMADNDASSWNNVAWHNISLGSGRQNSYSGWERMHRRVFGRSVGFFGKDKKILFLGGSHTITTTTYQSLTHVRGRSCTGLIVLDAHPDCCRKAIWPIHSDWLRLLVEGEFVFPENVLIIGLRQIEKQEKKFLDHYKVKYYRINDIGDVSNFTVNDFSVTPIMAKFRALGAVYLSIDIDVVSGVYAPGTGCPSPDGFTDREFLSLVKQLKLALPNLRAADIVEINPLNWWRKRILRYDPTVDLGVKLIKEIIS